METKANMPRVSAVASTIRQHAWDMQRRGIIAEEILFQLYPDGRWSLRFGFDSHKFPLDGYWARAVVHGDASVAKGATELAEYLLSVARANAATWDLVFFDDAQ